MSPSFLRSNLLISSVVNAAGAAHVQKYFSLITLRSTSTCTHEPQSDANFCFPMLQESACRKRIQYKSYDSSQMEKAMTAVQYDGKTMYRAAKEFKVPMNTLRDRLIAKGLFKPKTPNNSQVCVLH